MVRGLTSLSIVYLITISNLIAAPAGYFDLKPTTVITGDTWEQGGKTYRLYGVQSCLRDTFYTAKNAKKQDCGIASVDGFAAFVTDTKPFCAVIVTINNINYTMCYSHIGKEVVDFGMSLIVSGYAFAALNENGLPYIDDYSVAEKEAAENRNGLWMFDDVQHPAIFLSTHAKAQK